jgi:hypothetical protein
MMLLECCSGVEVVIKRCSGVEVVIKRGHIAVVFKWCYSGVGERPAHTGRLRSRGDDRYTLLLNCWFTVVTLLLPCCYTTGTLLLHCCYNVVTLLFLTYWGLLTLAVFDREEITITSEHNDRYYSLTPQRLLSNIITVTL